MDATQFARIHLHLAIPVTRDGSADVVYLAGVIAELFILVFHHQAERFVSFPILVENGNQFRQRHALFLVNESFDGKQGIRGIGDAAGFIFHRIVTGAAMEETFAALDTVVVDQGANTGAFSLADTDVFVVDRCADLDHVSHLPVKRILQLFIGVQCFGFTGVKADLLVVEAVVPIAHGQLQHLEKIVATDVAGKIGPAGQDDLRAAGQTVIPRFLQWITHILEHRDDHIVVVQGRQTLPGGKRCVRLVPELDRRRGSQPQGQIRAAEAILPHRLHHHQGQFVDGAAAILADAAHRHIQDTAAFLSFDEHVLGPEHGVLRRHAPVAAIPEIGIQVLVGPAE